jgi:hypothetical protein
MFNDRRIVDYFTETLSRLEIITWEVEYRLFRWYLDKHNWD